MKYNNVLITGGAGYVGTMLTERLAKISLCQITL